MKQNESDKTTETGLVVAAHKRHFLVERFDRSYCTCLIRGRNQDITVNDRVEIKLDSPVEGTILSVFPRTNQVWRADAFKQKTLASNVDVLFFLVAAEPSFSLSLLSRALAVARHQEIEFVIIANKSDCPNFDKTLGSLEPFRALGIKILPISAATDPAGCVQALGPYINHSTGLLMGQSGMGKSTLINALVPNAGAITREISNVLSSGKHTTTHTRSYPIDPSIAAQARLIDSPGFQQFGLAQFSPETLLACFEELHLWAAQCRFQDCQHRMEPDCAVKLAAQRGDISQMRLDHFLELSDEYQAIRRKRHY